MTISVEWSDEARTLVLVTYHGPWTWEESYDLQSKLIDMMEAEGHTVDFIYDMRDTSLIPQGALTHTRKMMSRSTPLAGEVVLVGANRFLQALYGIFAKVYGGLVSEKHFRLVATMDEAYAAVEAARKNRQAPAGTT